MKYVKGKATVEVKPPRGRRLGQCKACQSLDGIVVEEECPECWGSNDCVDANCITCNGTGTITRKAEWKEVIEWIKETLEIAEGHEGYKFVVVMKSGGRLRVKGKRWSA